MRCSISVVAAPFGPLSRVGATNPVRRLTLFCDRTDHRASHRLLHLQRDQRCIVSHRRGHHRRNTDDRNRRLGSRLPISPNYGGWRRRNVDRTDYYAKAGARVQLLWHGTEAISGGSLYHDDVLTAYTRDLSTIHGWLKR